MVPIIRQPSTGGQALARVQRVPPLHVVTVKMMATMPEYGAFSEAALRQLIFAAEDRFAASGEKVPGNGLNAAILRVGRRVLIDLDRFDEWLLWHRMAREGETGDRQQRARGPRARR